MNIDSTVYILVDVQGKLAAMMHDRDTLYEKIRKLTLGMLAMNIPVIWVEQIPEKMGMTIPELLRLLAGLDTVTKKSFSCCGEPAFCSRLAATGRRDVVVAGIEAHVCICQTAIDLQRHGYVPHVVADAVSSRTRLDKDLALQRLARCGCDITSVEMLLFELLGSASHPAFREILSIVK